MTMMKVVAPILLLAAIVVIALYWTIRKEGRVNSFRDVVRNPEAMTDLEAFHKDVEVSADALTQSPSEIQKLVDSYVFEEKPSSDSWRELRILALLREETYPRALQILNDPSLHD